MFRCDRDISPIPFALKAICARARIYSEQDRRLIGSVEPVPVDAESQPDIAVDVDPAIELTYQFRMRIPCLCPMLRMMPMP
jgi:hypothetical protein